MSVCGVFGCRVYKTEMHNACTGCTYAISLAWNTSTSVGTKTDVLGTVTSYLLYLEVSLCTVFTSSEWSWEQGNKDPLRNSQLPKLYRRGVVNEWTVILYVMHRPTCTHTHVQSVHCTHTNTHTHKHAHTRAHRHMRACSTHTHLNEIRRGLPMPTLVVDWLQFWIIWATGRQLLYVHCTCKQ